MKLRAEMRLLRLPGAPLVGLPGLYLGFSVMAMNSHALTFSIFPWLLVGSYFLAPLMGSGLGREFSLRWGRATAPLPIAASVRVLVIWWRRVVAPTVLVGILVVLYPLISRVDFFSWDVALPAFAIPFAGSSCWLLVTAASAADYWTQRSTQPGVRRAFQSFRNIVLLSLPFAIALWIDWEQARAQFSILFLLLGAIFSVLGAKRIYLLWVAQATDSVESRPALLQAPGQAIPGSGLTGFKLFALHYLLYGALWILPANVFGFLPFAISGMLFGIPVDQLRLFHSSIIPAIVLIMLSAQLSARLSGLRALRTLPLDASRISFGVTVLAVSPLLLSSTLTTVIVLTLYSSELSVHTFLFSIGGVGIASCTIIPACLYFNSGNSASGHLLVMLPTFAALGLWIGAFEFFSLHDSPLVAVAVAVTGIVLTWELIRELISRSSRAYRGTTPLTPAGDGP